MAAARRSPRSVPVAADAATVPAEAGAHGSALATLAAATAAVGERDRERERDDEERASDAPGEDAMDVLAADGQTAAPGAVAGRKRKAPTAGFQLYVPEKQPLPPSQPPPPLPSSQPPQQQQQQQQPQPQQQQQQSQQQQSQQQQSQPQQPQPQSQQQRQQQQPHQPQQRQPAARASPKEHHPRPHPQHQHPTPSQRQQPQQQLLRAESGSPEMSHTATTRMLLNAAAMSGGNAAAGAGHGASGVNGAGAGPGGMSPYAYAFAPNHGAFARYDELPPPFGGGARDLPHGGQALYGSPMPYLYNFAGARAQPGHPLFHPLTGMPLSAAHGLPGMFASPAASRPPPPGSHQQQQSPMPPASALGMSQPAASDRGAPSDGDLSAAGSAGHDAGGNGLGYRPVTVKTEMLPGAGMLSLTAPETDVRNRRESHRAIERRRRDHINSGIEELSKLVPGVPRSKGKTVHRAAAYIRHVAECEERFNQQVQDWLAQNQRQVERLQVQLRKSLDELAELRPSTPVDPALEALLNVPATGAPALRIRETFQPDTVEDGSDHEETYATFLRNQSPDGALAAAGGTAATGAVVDVDHDETAGRP